MGIVDEIAAVGGTSSLRAPRAPDFPERDAACLHERGQIGDSRFFGHLYSTDESRRIFCDNCRLQRWLDIEATLALSQAELGIVTTEVADRIAAAARIESLPLDRVRDEIRRTRHSLVALLRALQEACQGDAGEFVHYGATTQDIQDTGQALEMRDVLLEVNGGLEELLRVLSLLANAHTGTLMVGRTHARPALPLTFGLKVAGWLDELLRHVERIHAAKPRILVAQLFGGVGTMAGFGSAGPDLVERFAQRLGLGVPVVGWHVARDRVVEYVGVLAMVAGTLGRIADEVRTLSRPEFDEIAQSWEPGVVGSSTMPHKRNPEACQQVVVLARLAAAQVPVALQAMLVEHERDSRGLRLEWPVIADVSHYTLTALHITRQVVKGVEVNEGAMAHNAQEAATFVCTEALMLALGERIGKQTAHAQLYELCQSAKSDGRTLREQLATSQVVQQHLSEEDLDRIFDPRRHVGASSELVDRVLQRVGEGLARYYPDSDAQATRAR